MRFERYQQDAFAWTPRKAAAYRAKCRREIAALPLFADVVRQDQTDVDTERARRQAEWESSERRSRDHRAALWRKARALLRTLPNHQDATQRWNRHRWLPGHPWYLLDFIHGISTGR
jgi:hypothetical protein